MDRYVFPAVFQPEEGDTYTVTFPDLPGCVTQGRSLQHALAMARDALELHLYGMESDREQIPDPTRPDQVDVTAPAFCTLIEAWMPPVRDEMMSRPVKKTLTIPRWLNDLADEKGVNYSKVLQEALKERLEVRDRPRKQR